MPRNRIVPKGNRRVWMTKEIFFLLSEFKSVIDLCLSFAWIERFNLALRFTRKLIASQEKSALSIDECSISFTRNSPVQ